MNFLWRKFGTSDVYHAVDDNTAHHPLCFPFYAFIGNVPEHSAERDLLGHWFCGDCTTMLGPMFARFPVHESN